MGRNLEAKPVCGGNYGAHFLIGKMLAQAAPLLAEYAASRRDFDNIGPAFGGLAHTRCALDCPGAGVAAVKRCVHFGPETRYIAVAADNRDRGAC